MVDLQTQPAQLVIALMDGELEIVLFVLTRMHVYMHLEWIPITAHVFVMTSGLEDIVTHVFMIHHFVVFQQTDTSKTQLLMV